MEDQFVLACDLGTTAVKVAVIRLHSGPPALLAQGSADTNAYMSDGGGGASEGIARLQDVNSILRALNTAVGMMPDTVVQKCQHVAICDQMHGVVTWRWGPTSTVAPAASMGALDSAEAGATTRSELVWSHLSTWEDRQVDPKWLGELTASACGVTGATPMYPGYGLGTLVWHMQRGDLGPALAPNGSRACAGTIGSAFSSVLAGLDACVMDTTDAASWGCFNLKRASFDEAALCALSRVAPGLESYLPRLVEPGYCLGTLSQQRVALLGLTSFRFSHAPPAVYVCMGDHAAAVAGILALGSTRASGTVPDASDAAAADELSDDVAGAGTLGVAGVDNYSTAIGVTVIINVGTSAQVAAVGAGPAWDEAVSQYTEHCRELPLGCEIRPCASLTPTTQSMTPPQHDCATSTSSTSKSTSISPVPIPRPVGLTTASTAGAYMFVAASMNGGNVLSCLAERACAWMRAQDTADADKSAAYTALESAGMAAICAAGDADWHPVSAHEMRFARVKVDPRLVPERTIEATTSPSATTATPLLHIQHTQGVDGDGVSELTPLSGSVYVCAAASMLWNVCQMLPDELWQRCTRVQLTGGAFTKSAVLLAAAQHVLPFLRREGAHDSHLPPLQISQPPKDALAVVGAIGAAVTALTARGRVASLMK